MMGAYIAWTLIGWTDSFVLGALLALPATFLLGIAVEAVVMRRLYARDHLDQVLHPQFADTGEKAGRPYSPGITVNSVESRLLYPNFAVT